MTFLGKDVPKSKCPELVNSNKVGSGDFWTTRAAHVILVLDQC